MPLMTSSMQQVVANVLLGRNRDTPVEKNLKLFKETKVGLHNDGSLMLCLRWFFRVLI